jgi:hypothetical protein
MGLRTLEGNCFETNIFTKKMLAKIIETIIVHDLLRTLVGFVSPTILKI